MIDSIEINNFRSIENLKIENLKNVNFFFGRANTAKTTTLEAIHLYLDKDTKNISYLDHLNHRVTKENLNKLMNNEELDTLNEYCKKFDDDTFIEFMTDNNLNPSELECTFNWGITEDGRLVCLDYADCE